MRTAALLLLAIVTATAQNPAVQFRNTTNPISSGFQVGDRFQILITAAPNQPISVRTTRQGRTDWSPIIGSTDATGRWSATGRFERTDFGGWREIWTVGGRLASPMIQFSVSAACLPGGQEHASISGPNLVFSCETSNGTQTFRTPSLSDPFQTRDGRVVPGQPAEQTQRLYQMGIIEDLMTAGAEGDGISLQSSYGGLGDETAELIGELIGDNALTDNETRNVLRILRAAFARPDTIQPTAKQPSNSVALLRHLASITDDEKLKQEIAETVAYLLAVK